ncbi:MAG: MFS transporter [Flavobacteriales bacterium]|nr:MFS transporter [Flavobacteriales bacterium]
MYTRIKAVSGQIHSREALLVAFSKMLERAGYYGLRGILVLYMVGETMSMSATEAFQLYTFFTAAVALSQVFGGIIGDLLLGNKRAVLVGALLQSVGAFVIGIPSHSMLYTGAGLVVLGSGIYTPNIASQFAKQYLKTPKLLDAGFTIFYILITAGAFVGAIVIGEVGESHGWEYGFATSGVIILLAVLPMLFIKTEQEAEGTSDARGGIKNIWYIILGALVVGLFWLLYSLYGAMIFDIHDKLRQLNVLTVSKGITGIFDSIVLVGGLLIALFVWSYYYSHQFTKLAIGFLAAGMGMLALLIIGDTPTAQHLPVFISAIVLVAIGEVHVGPVFYGLLARYSNPKYLAITMGLAFVPSYVIASFFPLSYLLSDKLKWSPDTILMTGITITTGIGVVLLAVVYMVRINSRKRELAE